MIDVYKNIIFDLFGVLVDPKTNKTITEGAALVEWYFTQQSTLYLLSNTTQAILDIHVQTNPDLFSKFTALIISEKVKYKKPDPRIFLYMLSHYDLEPQQTLFIDDTQANIATAQSLKIHTLLSSDPATLKTYLQQLKKIFN